MNAQKPSPAISANEQLKAKLTQYVAEGKVFESEKIEEFDKVSEFGKFMGINASGNFYEGKSHSLIISFEDVDDSHKKILDFILDEKGKLGCSGRSYNDCAIYKNGKKNSDGFYTGDEACNEASVVKLKTAETDCMIVIPIVKAWKRGDNGKFVEVSATGLTWYDGCP